MPLAVLKRWPRNPKLHDKKTIGASINRFGYVDPIVIDEKSGRMVKGHGRLEELEQRKQSGKPPPARVRMENGDWLVPVVRGVAFKSEREAEAYLLVDNRATELGGWDETILATILREMKESDAMLEGLGWSDHELSKFLKPPAAPGEEEPVDPLPEKAESKLGEVYELGPHRLICGDAREPTVVAELMGKAKADCFFTDPPYNVDYTGKTKKKLKLEHDKKSEKDFLEFLVRTLSNAREVTKPGAAFYLCHADLHGHVFRAAVADSGWHMTQCLIWVKDVIVMGRSDYHWQHEPILYGWNPGMAHRWYGDRKQSTVWPFARPKQSELHPTIKPIELVEHAIVNSTQVGGLVLDLFVGSGTSIAAAARTGRIARAAEIDPRYCDVVRTRWDKLAQQLGVKPGKGALG